MLVMLTDIDARMQDEIKDNILKCHQMQKTKSRPVPTPLIPDQNLLLAEDNFKSIIAKRFESPSDDQ